jgi:phenylalanyl-tRNA synthetase beta chain
MKLERSIKEILSKASGLTEIYNYSFVGDEQLKKLNINFSKHIRLANPISVNHTMCRQSLAPNLMENIRFNQARYDSLRFYEFGSVFFDLPGGINKDVSRKYTLPYQEKKIGIIIAEEKNGLPYSEIKKVVENLFDFLNLDISYEKNENLIGWEDQFSAAKIKANGVDVGYLCLADKKIINSIGLKKETAIAEINFDLLFELVGKQPEKKYKELPKYPPLVRDLAFVISSKILYNNIKREIEDFNQLISRVELFDVYEEGKLGIGKKSLAFHLNYQSLERTLTGEEVDELQKELVKKLEAKFEAQIRNF